MPSVTKVETTSISSMVAFSLPKQAALELMLTHLRTATDIEF